MKIFLSLIFFCLTLGLFAQTGQIFPKMQGQTLDGKNLYLPLKNGRYSVIAIAFDRDAETDLKKWLNPLYNVFIKKEPGGGMDMAELYDVNFVFVPLISGFKRIADEFKKGTDKEFWSYILDTEKTDIKELQVQLKISDNKIPYFYVLDKEGKIVQMQSGKYSEDKMDKLEDGVE